MQEPRRHSHIDANPVSLDLYASKPSTFAIPTHANSCQFTAVLDPCSVATLSPPTQSPLVTLPAMPDTGTERDGSESDRTRRIAEAAHSHTKSLGADLQIGLGADLKVYTQIRHSSPCFCFHITFSTSYI
ncbi:hypothetical protein BLNAU_18203 [Blattamonas nauphoetae]|uniref:Uncharacterized protein n=1 Tax=Blattamonas nauphoetae TaxID=2049346 RepID=A0ABQ9X553_9EUKA|nr:hypothetical protein BLNAU_18203 [Blattamonas nauphoetae]